MKRQDAIAVAWVIGMLVAPDNLILLGNIAGSMGVIFIILLVGGILVYVFHSRCYKNIALYTRGATGEFEWISNVLGPATAVIFSIGVRVLTAVFLATATLVASGYVFNEVFVQRFPNFAFAFLMLGALLAINLYSREMSGKIQLLLSATAVAGLFVLSMVGIFQWLKTTEVVPSATLISPLTGSFSVLLLFIGFDLLTLSRNQSADKASGLQRHLFLGLCLAAAVFCLWGIASLLQIPSERLAGTTIPHILAAKKILGQPGRIVMGLVIIAGTGAAVNALFVAVGGMMADLNRKAILPFLPRFFKHSLTTMILLALVIAVMMALGVAGTDDLDTYIRASLILWLLNYGLLNLVVILPGDRRAPKLNESLSWRQTAPHGAIFMLMLAGSVILIATDDNPGLIIRFLCFIFFGIGLPIWVGGRVQSRRRRSPFPDGR
jgi:amino acid transporter